MPIMSIYTYPAIGFSNTASGKGVTADSSGTFTTDPDMTSGIVKINDDDAIFNDASSASPKDTGTPQTLAEAYTFTDGTGFIYTIPAGTRVFTASRYSITSVAGKNVNFTAIRVTFEGTISRTSPTGETTTVNSTGLVGFTGDSVDKLPQPGEAYTWTSGNNVNTVGSYSDGTTPFADFITCFCTGTLIRIQDGVGPIEDLRVGDMVLTLDHGLQPVRWIGSRCVSTEELTRFPNLQPIRIKAGALCANIPDADLIVSPQHRILLRSKIIRGMFNTDEVLVVAKHLLECDSIEVAEDMTEAEYFHILFDQHEIVFSNAAETESLHTGTQAIKALNPAAREEIFTLFPELQEEDPTGLRPVCESACKVDPLRWVISV